MRLPTNIKVGLVKYRIMQPPAMRAACSRGQVSYKDAVITVAHSNKVTQRNYTMAERREVFWHELTHAVLHHMGHELTYDETFVTRFAKVLSDAIDSATFD